MNYIISGKLMINVNGKNVWEEMSKESFAKRHFNLQRNGQQNHGHRDPLSVFPSWAIKGETLAWNTISGYHMTIDNAESAGIVRAITIDLKARGVGTKVAMEVEFSFNKVNFFQKVKAYFYTKSVIKEKLRAIKRELEGGGFAQEAPEAA